MIKKSYIFGGGTIQHIRPHLALSAPAYGTVAKQIRTEIIKQTTEPLKLVLTKMADPLSEIETNSDVERRLLEILRDPDPCIIYFSVAMCDFIGTINGVHGKHYARLESSNFYEVHLEKAYKVIDLIRQRRKDIFLVGFKTTAGLTEDEQFNKGLKLSKRASANLVLANDITTKNNIIITPEGARYGSTTDRDEIVKLLVEMTTARSNLSFTRTTVIESGELTPWDDPQIPSTLRRVMDYCTKSGAYKTFNGKTPGHYGYRRDEKTLLSSVRKKNYNHATDRAMVEVVFDEDGEVYAYGAKPSVGARSQFEVLSAFPQFDCIVHFHCPMAPTSKVPIRLQRDFECGSHECGSNTKDGIMLHDGIGAVMLDKHGPNIIFKSTDSANKVIEFIKQNFNLKESIR
jgi:hypothetical protein